MLNAELNNLFNDFKAKTGEGVIINANIKDCAISFPVKKQDDIFALDSNAEYKRFFAALWAYNLEGRNYWINEKQYTNAIEHSGFMFDFDVYQKSNSRRLGNTVFIQIIRKITKIMFGQINMADSYVNYVFVLTNPNLTKKDDLYKEGFHILFPSVKVDKMVKSSIMEEVKKKMAVVFKSIDDVESPEKAFDGASVYVPTQLYGTLRAEKEQTHKVTAVYKVTFKSQNLEDVTSEFLYTKAVGKTPGKSKHNVILETSLIYSGNVVKKEIFKSRDEAVEIIKSNSKTFHANIENSQEMIKKQVQILNDTDYRARELILYLTCLASPSDDYGAWLNKVIKNILFVDLRYAPIARIFAQKHSEKWKDQKGVLAFNKIFDEVDMILKKATSSRDSVAGKNFGAIKKMARESDPVEYENVKQKSLQGSVEAMLSSNVIITDTKLGNIIKEILGDRFYCIPLKRPGYSASVSCYWLEYVMQEQHELPTEMKPYVNKWYRHDGFPLTIDKLLTSEISGIFNNLYRRYTELKQKDPENPAIKEILNVLASTIKKCENESGIRSIKARLQTMLQNNEVLIKLDKEGNLFGVYNGVLRFNKKSVELVRGGNIIYISQTTDIPYEPFDENSKTVKKVMKVLSDILPDAKKRAGLLMHFSQLFVAKSCKRYFNIFQSKGSSGKSIVMDLFKNALGMRGTSGFNSNFGYYNTTEASAFMHDKLDVNGVDHHMMKLQNARLIHCPEGKTKGVIQTHIIKKLRDSPGCRGIFESVQNFDYEGIIVMLTNAQIKFSDYNYAIYRRFLYMHFPVHFSVEYKQTDNIYKKPLDESIEGKVKKKSWGTAFLSILVKHWEMLQSYKDADEMLRESGILQETNEYYERYDFITRFINSMLAKAEGESIDLKTLSSFYIEWCKVKLQEPTTETQVEIIQRLKDNLEDHIKEDQLVGFRFTGI